jgi:DNA-directed RNA polymerase specialized sigma24 family protein
VSEQRSLYYPPADVDPAARALIKHKAKRLVGSYGFTRSDRDDLEQELAMKAFLASATFDPARGTVTSFFNRVLANKANSLARHATRIKRDRRNDVPLDEVHLVTPDWRGDLRVDVADALDDLSEADRAVAPLLATQSVAAVARITGHTRGVIREAKRRIARALAAKNLAPISRGAEPDSEPTGYVLVVGTFHSPSRRASGPEGKALAALHPTRGSRSTPSVDGAPPCPRP